MVRILEQCRVSPPPSSVGEQSLPLTFSDLMWIHLHLVQSLFFYKYPHSKTHFVGTTAPTLKQSLSLALKHFYPFAGNLLFPPNLREPEIHYRDGDSVSLTIGESDEDFDYLIKNQPREVARFHPLIPQLPPVSVQHGTLVASLLAVQITLFPHSGISFGFTLNHVAADGNSFVRFMKLWATIHKSLIEPMVPEPAPAVLPFFDRSSILKQTYTLSSIYWQKQQKTKFEGYRPLLPTSNIMASFLLTEADLQRLKKRVMVQCPTLSHVSSFTVTCAYTWVCIVKARAWSGGETTENELEIFGFGATENELEIFCFGADFRAYLDPPLPENYFGNCLVPCYVAAKNSQLKEEDGFITAAKLIGDEIQRRLGSKEGLWEYLKKVSEFLSSTNIENLVSVAGSPRFRVYDIDFGLGELQRREFISIDETRAISLHEGKDNRRDFDVCLTLPKMKMEAFASIFGNGLTVPED